MVQNLVSGIGGIVIALVIAWFSISGPNDSGLPMATDVFRTVDEVFELPQDEGWTVLIAPGDEQLYRICGATRSQRSGKVSLLQGTFEASGQSVNYSVAVPAQKWVEVVGLEPIDGGPLTYAVLTQDLAAP